MHQVPKSPKVARDMQIMPRRHRSGFSGKREKASGEFIHWQKIIKAVY